MILDGVPYEEVVLQSGENTAPRKAVIAFIRWLEKRLGVQVVYDRRRAFQGYVELAPEVELARRLIKANVIKAIYNFNFPPDLPGVKLWKCRPTDWTPLYPGGAAVTHKAALVAGLAESMERYLWFTQKDYYKDPVEATEQEMAGRGVPYIPLSSFQSYSKEERARSARYELRSDAKYLWIKAQSLTQGREVYVPAQTVSAAWAQQRKEPLIREYITTGLATWPTQAGARTAGFLEVVERDAYMITWLNQLSMPKVAVASLRGQNLELDRLVDQIERYRFKLHVVKLCTDAPAHAVSVIIEDTTDTAPKFSVGLKAHFNMAEAVYGALMEAIRANHSNRNYYRRGESWDTSFPEEDVGHVERVRYWSVPETAEHLRFLVLGKEELHTGGVWEHDTKEMYLERAIAWCKEKQYDLLCVPLGISKANVTPWYVEMTVVPQLTPTYLYEARRQTGSSRIQSVPLALGYSPRETPFVERPHPFA